MRLRELQLLTGIWSDRTFGSGEDRHRSTMNHLKREVDEIIADPSDLEEYADVLILLVDAARMAGFHTDDLLDAAYAKHEVNKKRTWKPADIDGVHEHE